LARAKVSGGEVCCAPVTERYLLGAAWGALGVVIRRASPNPGGGELDCLFRSFGVESVHPKATEGAVELPPTEEA